MKLHVGSVFSGDTTVPKHRVKPCSRFGYSHLQEEHALILVGIRLRGRCCEYSPTKVGRVWGIWGSYCNIPKAICYLLKGDYNL